MKGMSFVIDALNAVVDLHRFGQRLARVTVAHRICRWDQKTISKIKLYPHEKIIKATNLTRFIINR